MGIQMDHQQDAGPPGTACMGKSNGETLENNNMEGSQWKNSSPM
jgi:hypothetical protein